MLYSFVKIFENFRVSDALDIMVVSVILYKFFSTLHGTRATRVLIGLIGLAILYWFSFTFGLYSLNWFLKHFFDYFFVIIIIIFQEQLRSILANFGKTSRFFKPREDFYMSQIEEVVAACSALSKEKMGALIVFEKAYGLLNFSATGTKLDSKVHADLLYSLFQPTSPLHDGAVIILQDRIQAAGCFLPLSKKLDMERNYGARHRAAMGLSEVSDAVVVVVSEETGKMSLCLNGHFVNCADEAELRKRLREQLFSRADKASVGMQSETSL